MNKWHSSFITSLCVIATMILVACGSDNNRERIRTSKKRGSKTLGLFGKTVACGVPQQQQDPKQKKINRKNQPQYLDIKSVVDDFKDPKSSELVRIYISDVGLFDGNQRVTDDAAVTDWLKNEAQWQSYNRATSGQQVNQLLPFEVINQVGCKSVRLKLAANNNSLVDYRITSGNQNALTLESSGNASQQWDVIDLKREKNTLRIVAQHSDISFHTQTDPTIQSTDPEKVIVDVEAAESDDGTDGSGVVDSTDTAMVSNDTTIDTKTYTVRVRYTLEKGFDKKGKKIIAADFFRYLSRQGLTNEPRLKQITDKLNNNKSIKQDQLVFHELYDYIHCQFSGAAQDCSHFIK